MITILIASLAPPSVSNVSTEIYACRDDGNYHGSKRDDDHGDVCDVDDNDKYHHSILCITIMMMITIKGDDDDDDKYLRSILSTTCTLSV